MKLVLSVVKTKSSPTEAETYQPSAPSLASAPAGRPHACGCAGCLFINRQWRDVWSAFSIAGLTLASYLHSISGQGTCSHPTGQGRRACPGQIIMRWPTKIPGVLGLDRDVQTETLPPCQHFITPNSHQLTTMHTTSYNVHHIIASHLISSYHCISSYHIISHHIIKTSSRHHQDISPPHISSKQSSRLVTRRSMAVRAASQPFSPSKTVKLAAFSGSSTAWYAAILGWPLASRQCSWHIWEKCRISWTSETGPTLLFRAFWYIFQSVSWCMFDAFGMCHDVSTEWKMQFHKPPHHPKPSPKLWAFPFFFLFFQTFKKRVVFWLLPDRATPCRAPGNVRWVAAVRSGAASARPGPHRGGLAARAATGPGYSPRPARRDIQWDWRKFTGKFIGP